MAELSIQELTQRLIEMEKRLKVTEDIEQIKQLHRRYENYHTFGDEWGRLSCYAENAILEYGGMQYKGKKAIAEHMRLTGKPEPWVDKENPLPAGHFVIHPLITVDGDRAKGTWLMYEMQSHARTYQSLFWVQGLYDCDYVRENGEWKFSYHRWRPRISPPGTPPWETPLVK